MLRVSGGNQADPRRAMAAIPVSNPDLGANI